MSTNETLNSNEILKLRIKHTSGTTDEWKSIQETFKPKKGEVIVYIDNFEDNNVDVKAKIGDGVTTLEYLPFVMDQPITDDKIEYIVTGKVTN